MIYLISCQQNKLNKNLCENCAPFDGLVFTLDELKAQGLQLSHPVNPNCLGKDNDRCQIAAFKLK